MKLTELLEEEKDAMLRAASGAGTKDDARAAVERTLERMLFAFNDASPSQKAREQAAAMVGALRAALPLMDSAGEPKIYETRGDKGAALPPLALALLILGCAACLAACGLMLYHDIPWPAALLPVYGMLFIGAAGHPARMAAAKTQRTVEVPTDWDKVWRTLHTAALVMDQTLDDAASEERWTQRRRAETNPVLTAAETELVTALLEGLYGGDGEYAIEKLAAVRQYLKEKGVETVDYDGQHAQMFDRMPGAETATLRPALIQSGTLLCRGLATVPD